MPSSSFCKHIDKTSVFSRFIRSPCLSQTTPSIIPINLHPCFRSLMDVLYYPNHCLRHLHPSQCSNDQPSWNCDIAIYPSRQILPPCSHAPLASFPPTVLARTTHRQYSFPSGTPAAPYFYYYLFYNIIVAF